MINFLKNHKKFIKIASLVAIILGLAFIIVGSFKPDQSSAVNKALAKVELINIADYFKSNSKISITGQVESSNQVELRSQTSANVKQILVGLGDAVIAGQTIAIFANDDIYAQLLQAEAGLEAEKARLDEIKMGARIEEISIKELQLASAQKDLEDLYDRAIDTLNNTYIQSDGAIRSQLAGIFSGSQSNGYQLTYVTCTAQAEINANWQRSIADYRFEDWQAALELLNLDSTQIVVDQAIDNGQEYLELFKNLLENLNETLTIPCALNNSGLDGYRTIVNGSRTLISGLISAINGLEQGIVSLGLNIDRIKEELELLEIGATEEQIKAQAARVKLAEAGVSLAKAQYNKTIITTPISGHISVLPVRLGELISPGQLVASVVNVAGLKIKAYIDASEFSHVFPEDRVVIEERVEGFVMRLAPSIDPTTKKVEVEIMVNDPLKANLVIGQFVNLDILTSNGSEKDSIYILPLQSIKLTSEAAFVYTVDQNNEIVANQVVLGSIVGQSIEILEGLDESIQIVSSVRGLKKGQKIEVK